MPTYTMRNVLVLALIGVSLWPAAVRAEDTVLATAVPLQKPRKSEPRGGRPLDKVEISIFLPEGARTIRGAVVNPFYVKTVEQKHWQETARLWGFAVIGANYAGVGAAEFGPTLQAALQEFALKGKRPELVHLPFCFVGMSAGAGMSMKFAESMPERTLAVAPVCLEVGPASAVTRKIPTLTVFGEKDGRQMKLLTEKLPAERKEGALWAVAVQWGRGHEFGQANNLVLPFFDDVIRRRYPAEVTPEKGPVKLIDYPEAEGWLADRTAWGKGWPAIASPADYKGDRGEACWLPSRKVASVWRAFVASSRTVRIAAPAGLGDGQPFSTHAAGSPITVTVEVTDKNPKKIELFDGDVSLGERTSAPFEFAIKLSPGIHSLIAVATPEGQVPVVSKPSTLIVRQELERR